MGCGGSRTDALEPRYPESWTKETESTWLTSTDTDVALSSIQKIPSENFSESGFASEKNLSSGDRSSVSLHDYFFIKFFKRCGRKKIYVTKAAFRMNIQHC
uniref:BAALC binder of MAP3K1 and KLF4 b n=1 Tax=Scleropages formosus TaxID=113540 RepID=A0A8C9W477_SCLFO